MISFKSQLIFMTVVLSITLHMAFSQRSPYAGSRPSGYKDRFRPATNTNNNSDNDIVNRFGGPGLDGTQRPPVQGVSIVYGESVPISQTNQRVPVSTQSSFPNNIQSTINQQQQPNRIPYDAYGDIDFVNRVSNLPIDHQPFWLINYQAIEAQRNGTGNNFNTVSSRSSFLGK